MTPYALGLKTYPFPENMFDALMKATKYCSLGQLTAALFEGGQHRLNR